MPACATVRCLRRGREALRCEFELPLLRWASCIRLVLLGAAIWAALCFLVCFLLACANLAISSVSARTQKTLDAVHEEFGVNVASNNGDAAKAEMVILAVKPQMYESVIAEVAPSLSSEAIVVSIAPGKTLSWLGRKNGREKNRAIDAQYTCCHWLRYDVCCVWRRA